MIDAVDFGLIVICVSPGEKHDYEEDYDREIYTKEKAYVKHDCAL